MLRPLLENPTADLWFLASQSCEDARQEIGCLRQVLKLDPQHSQARRRYNQLRASARDNPQHDMPPIEALVADLDTLQPALEDFASPVLLRADIYAVKKASQKQERRRWNRIGCGAALLMSLSLGYFVLTVTGSPIPAQIRQFLSGGPPATSAHGTPIFGKSGTADQSLTPEPGNPINSMSNGTLAPTHDPSDETYADEAQAAGFEVKPTKSEVLEPQKAAGDVLDPGFAHEYTFQVSTGQEFALAVQFFSPTARNVEANVAILDPDGYNAEQQCQRDHIFVDGSGIAFTCQVQKGGNWKVQLFGRAGESTGVYVVTFQPM